MSQWDKLLDKIIKLSKEVRFNELKKYWKAMGIQ